MKTKRINLIQHPAHTMRDFVDELNKVFQDRAMDVRLRYVPDNPSKDSDLTDAFFVEVHQPSKTLLDA